MDRGNKITLQCAGIENKNQLHDLLAEALLFPEYYGRNLDALFDCLTDIRTDTVITLTNWDTLGAWKAGFEAVFRDASAEDPHLTFLYE